MSAAPIRPEDEAGGGGRQGRGAEDGDGVCRLEVAEGDGKGGEMSYSDAGTRGWYEGGREGGAREAMMRSDAGFH